MPPETVRVLLAVALFKVYTPLPVSVIAPLYSLSPPWLASVPPRFRASATLRPLPLSRRVAPLATLVPLPSVAKPSALLWVMTSVPPETRVVPP